MKFIFSFGIFFWLFLFVSCKNDNPRQEFYDNGNLKSEIFYQDSLKNGLAKEFYENGVLKREVLYKNDRKEGLEKEYYKSGTLAAEYPYENGYISGKVRRYHENGKLSFEALFEKNKQIEFGKYFEASGEHATDGSYKDIRDGYPYEWVKIDNQIWINDNMNFATASGSVCMQCNTWGRLYNFEMAKISCPSSFHLPSISDYKTLFDYAGKKPGFKLKAGVSWDAVKTFNDFGNGSDDFGFSAEASGAHFAKSNVAIKDRKFKYAGKRAYFWTAEGKVVVFYHNRDDYSIENFNPEYGASVRCVMDFKE